mmetsp:Transcript_31031/g.62159  ORF Transcript_31031/g.62159 Transcript_31031/m.62159 type:complete len:177 (-) Transcript_31031:223-753(-)|eukprot:CAMPEP_0174720456 /NCGR_PEP_ID=MMETSP1094-20130205/33579_1 /TAXON_ID=156173 /ORGANISM="Chrysochromulina brevifilum, Strain UTEX LB 985" /LENGTH=176 /DNA_ID=CAMNT_0015920939 /DNA_START=119 /DNA_END=649 /DNA_ORIENTATION=-
MPSVEEVGGSSSKYDNYDKRVVVWPVYIDKKKTIAEGRKIPKEYCVDYPQMPELKEVLEHLGFQYAFEEHKAYPRDLSQWGRFRVVLKDPVTGEPAVDGIMNRRQLLQQMGSLIPKLKSRQEGKPKVPGSIPGMPFPGYPETLLPVAGPLPADGAAAAAAASGGSGGGSSKKKKGK